MLTAASQSQTMSYDRLGRMTSRAEPEGTATWTYDTGTGLTVGRLVSESVGGFSRSYTYNAAPTASPPRSPRRSTGRATRLPRATTRPVAGDARLPGEPGLPGRLAVGYFYNVRGYLEQVSGPSGALYYQVAEQTARAAAAGLAG